MTEQQANEIMERLSADKSLDHADYYFRDVVLLLDEHARLKDLVQSRGIAVHEVGALETLAKMEARLGEAKSLAHVEAYHSDVWDLLSEIAVFQAVALERGVDAFRIGRPIVLEART